MLGLLLSLLVMGGVLALTGQGVNAGEPYPAVSETTDMEPFYTTPPLLNKPV